jgi:cytochrome c biogenesis protein CcdA
MGITTSLLLLAIGAIVVAVTTYNTVGWILVAVGALGIVLSLIFWSAWGGFGARDGGRRTTVIEE